MELLLLKNKKVVSVALYHKYQSSCASFFEKTFGRFFKDWNWTSLIDDVFHCRKLLLMSILKACWFVMESGNVALMFSSHDCCESYSGKRKVKSHGWVRAPDDVH